MCLHEAQCSASAVACAQATAPQLHSLAALVKAPRIFPHLRHSKVVAKAAAENKVHTGGLAWMVGEQMTSTDAHLGCYPDVRADVLALKRRDGAANLRLVAVHLRASSGMHSRRCAWAH
jgi:hypothetical protein